MSMSRQDYRAIAAAIAETREELRPSAEAGDALNVLTDRLITIMQADNQRFDRDRFRRASGYESVYDPWEDTR